MFSFKTLEKSVCTKNFLVGLSIIAILGAIVIIPQSSVDPLKVLFEQNYDENKIFTKATQRSLAISKHILECCESEADVINLLDKSGFTMKIIDNPEKVEAINRRYRQTKEFWQKKYSNYIYEDYDAFIWAEKSNTPFSPAYKINLFLKDGKVSWVIARKEQTML